MDVLVVGNYTREHALCWKLKQSEHVGKVYIAPGNGGAGNVAANLRVGNSRAKLIDVVTHCCPSSGIHAHSTR